ncbi:MAG TPA: SRPBCC family protein, partial [Chloroflexota bacterium]
IQGNDFRGEYLEVEPPHRVVVSWGLAGSDAFAPGSSRVEFTLVATRGGTTLRVLHTGLPERHARRHALGWAHYLARLTRAARGDLPCPDPGFAQEVSTTGE